MLARLVPSCVEPTEMSYLNVQFGKFAADSVADRGRMRVVIKVSRNGAAISWSNRIAAAADLAFDVRCLRLRCLQSCLSQNRPAALGGIFLPIDRRDMRRVSIEIWPADPKLRLVRIDPLPQLLA